MEIKKLSFIKRISIFVLCTCILFSTVFMSYRNTIKAQAAIDDDFGAFTTVCYMGLIVAGGIEIVMSGGTLTPIAVGQIAVGLTSGGHDIYHYIKDNGDGTYTMSEEFIQAVIDEAAKLDEEGFHDFKSIQNSNGFYRVKGVSVQYTSGYVTKINGTTDYRPYGVGSLDDTIWINEYINENNWQTVAIPRESYKDGELKSTGYTRVLGDQWSTSSINIPVFSTNNDALAAFASGNFTTALNYKDKPLFQYSSNYSPTYTGGPVRFSKAILEGFDDMLKDVDERFDSVDEKIEALQNYIIGTDSDTSDSGTSDDDINTGENNTGDSNTNNSGSSEGSTEMSTINSWLSKIYYKLCDMFDYMKSQDKSNKDSVSENDSVSGNDINKTEQGSREAGRR